MATETAASLFGTHNGITCDGCGTKPIIGFSWSLALLRRGGFLVTNVLVSFAQVKCKNCPNHDFCEACYEDFGKGTLRDFTHRQNPVSKKLEDHAWEQHVNHKDFKSSVKQGDGGRRQGEEGEAQ
eukprot:jgi/Tetstr1/456149/TSEL_004087.t1